MLATIGATAPFIGLFGTVWGILNAFKQIGATHQAGIDVVGPGIAEALVTTAAGIIVAIEAMAIYNYFMARLQRATLELKLMSEEFVELLREQKTPERVAATGTTGAG
jgi:biopolymer transport protein ExbB